MTTIVYALDKIAEWLEREVCGQVRLKPHALDDMDTEAFKYELVHPSVFPLYVPPTDRKPPKVKATTPSICVQLIDGADSFGTLERKTRYRLALSAWDPGIHGPDVLTPTDETSADFGRVYERGESGSFQLTAGGWRDVWNFVDTTLRVIEADRTLGGFPLDPAEPITYGPFDDDGAMPDYQPFWFAWIEVSTKSQAVSASPAIENLL